MIGRKPHTVIFCSVSQKPLIVYLIRSMTAGIIMADSSCLQVLHIENEENCSRSKFSKNFQQILQYKIGLFNDTKLVYH